MASRRERRKAAQKEEQARIWGAFAGVAMALVPQWLPRLPIVIFTVLFVVWIASWRMARDGYKYHLPIYWALVPMIAHGAVIAAIGYSIWPRIVISPSDVSFQGFPNETFNFSIRNGRADDVYDIQVPFLIGYNKHFDNKFLVKVTPNGDPPSPDLW
jgi:hypothetical protein